MIKIENAKDEQLFHFRHTQIRDEAEMAKFCVNFDHLLNERPREKIIHNAQYLFQQKKVFPA